jgi:hypothetical protein
MLVALKTPTAAPHVIRDALPKNLPQTLAFEARIKALEFLSKPNPQNLN